MQNEGAGAARLTNVVVEEKPESTG